MEPIPFAAEIVISGTSMLTGMALMIPIGLKWMRRFDAADAECTDLKATVTRLDGLIDEMDHTHALDLMAADNRAKKQDDLIRKQGIEIAEFRADRAKRLAPLKAANAKRHAEKLARAAEKKAFHDAMRAEIEAAAAILNRVEKAA